MTAATWTARDVQRLAELWADPALSQDHIAVILDKSRKAVRTQVERMGLGRRRPRPKLTADEKRSRAAERQRRRRAEQRRATSTIHHVRPPRPQTPRPPRTPAVHVPTGPLVALADLEAHHCRFPFGEPEDEGFGFCGQPTVEGRPYCRGHCEVVFSGFGETP